MKQFRYIAVFLLAAFIQKPFSMADMTAKVRELLDMASDKSCVLLSLLNFSAAEKIYDTLSNV